MTDLEELRKARGGEMSKIPRDAKTIDGKVYDRHGDLIELYDGRWQKVINGNRSGWWRFNSRYDRDGYCDNPSRGY